MTNRVRTITRDKEIPLNDFFYQMYVINVKKQMLNVVYKGASKTNNLKKHASFILG